VLMWEVFSYGQLPYPRLTALETMLAIGTGVRLPRPAHCPAGMYRLMRSSWHLEPEGDLPCCYTNQVDGLPLPSRRIALVLSLAYCLRCSTHTIVCF